MQPPVGCGTANLPKGCSWRTRTKPSRIERGLMPLHKNEVGSDLYVWTQSEGNQSTGVVEVVISAHGEDVPANMNGMESAPDCMLAFYGPHGHILNALPLENTLSGQAVPHEWKKPKEVQDYL